MTKSLHRRRLLKTLAAYGAGLVIPEARQPAAQGTALELGKPFAFSFERLKSLARRLAARPYVPPGQPSPEVVARIDYEAWGKISFDTSYALFAEGPGRFPVTFFHLGQWFPKAVRAYVVDRNQAREILYNQRYFAMPSDSVARRLPAGSGFAGFKVQEARDGSLDWHKNDWVAFLGASYFRAIGELRQYGISARGLALDTSVGDRPEEFPDFTRFYIDRVEGANTVTVYALLEGPSVVGAYRFDMARGAGVVMDVECMLILRRPVERFGIAPLTSMFWFSETKKPTAIDWRPEVHDSDGLAIWNGRGEHLWRPLNTPPRAIASAFIDDNPRGFGLLQRDRSFDHYLDGVFYDRRPSLWVQPKGAWGKGAVQLIELPTDDEIHDNVVAMWVPDAPPAPGQPFSASYRLYWLADEPHPTELARCVATRLGNGGQPGKPRPQGVRKFVVEFLGGPLATLPAGVKPEMVMQTSRGFFTDYRIIEAVPDGIAGHWRAEFDLAGVEGSDPVELRLYLAVDGHPQTETWLYQYHPF